MANLETIEALKADFSATGPHAISANGQQKITGPRLNAVLNNIIDTLVYVLGSGGGGSSELVEVEEDGFYVVDPYLNIGVSITSEGVLAYGVPSVEIVED